MRKYSLVVIILNMDLTDTQQAILA
ncbi:repressor LexA, partial [Xanthomonas oryzae pv. oryzae]